MDWLTNATGKYFSNNTLSRKARAMGQPQVRFRQFCKREGQYGKRSGQVLLSNLASESRTIELQWLHLEPQAGDVRRGTLFRIDQSTGSIPERVEALGEGSGSFRWEVPAHAFVWFRLGMH